MLYNEIVVSSLLWTQSPLHQDKMVEHLSQGYYPWDCAVCYTQSVEPYYGTLVGADNYFKTRLHTQQWDFAEKDERVAALHMATRQIETLNFRGQRANPKQILFFPRTIDVPGFTNKCQCCGYIFVEKDYVVNYTRSFWGVLGYPPICPDHKPNGTPIVPGEIEVACYEIALCFLNGFDLETETRNLSVTSQGYAGARTSYARDFIQDHLRAGIPSALAWSILRPYLNDPQRIKLTRSS